MAEKKAFPLRLPQDLHDQVQRLASAELRSVNAQIEILLREALKKRGVTPPSPNQDSGQD